MDENKSLEAETIETKAEPEKEVVHCKKCGAVLGGNFCSKCGTPVSDQPRVFCPKCGGEVVDMVCTVCGKKFKRTISRKRLYITYFSLLLIPSTLICLLTQGINGYTLATYYFFCVLALAAFYAIISLLSLIIVSVMKRGKVMALNVLILSSLSFAVSSILFLIALNQ